MKKIKIKIKKEDFKKKLDIKDGETPSDERLISLIKKNLPNPEPIEKKVEVIKSVVLPVIKEENDQKDKEVVKRTYEISKKVSRETFDKDLSYESIMARISGKIDYEKDITNKPVGFPRLAGSGYLKDLSDVFLNDLKTDDIIKWDGKKWVNTKLIGGGSWGLITGDIEDQTDLIEYLGKNYQVKGNYIQSVNGNLVDNTDPQNPIILEYLTITMTDFQTLKDNAQLKSFTWYLITDYKTIAPVRGTESNTNPTMYTGATEEIYVFALTENTIDTWGISKTYANEKISLVDDRTDYPGTADIYYVEDTQAGTFQVDNITSTSLEVVPPTPTQPITSGVNIIAHDSINNIDLFLDDSGLGIYYTYVNGILTLIALPPGSEGFDLLGAFDATPGSGSYFYFTWGYIAGTSKGMIVSRENFGTNFYMDTDYRGIKVRRYEPMTNMTTPLTTWTSGSSWSPGDIALYSSTLYLCVASYSGTVSPGGSALYFLPMGNLNITDTTYVFPEDMTVMGYTLYANKSKFVDKSPIPTVAMYTGVAKVNTRILGSWNVNNFYCLGSITESVISQASQSRFNLQSVLSSNIISTNGGNIIMGTVNNGQINAIYESIISQISNSNIYSVNNCGLYTVNNFTGVISASIITSSFNYSSLDNVSNTLVRGALTLSKLGQVNGLTVNGNCTSLEAQSITNSSWTSINNCVLKTAISGKTYGAWTNIELFGTAPASFSTSWEGTKNITSLSVNYLQKNQNYTLLQSDHTVELTGTTARAFLLDTAVGVKGIQYILKNSGTLSTSLLTINTTSSQTIDGVTTLIIKPGESMIIESDGANWKILGGSRKRWTKYTAGSVTLTAGTSANTVNDLQTMADGTFYTVAEVASAPGINLIVDFTGVLAIDQVRVLGGYVGDATHSVGIQLYNWTTTNWDTFNAFQNAVIDTTTANGYILDNRSFQVYDDTNYIGTGANVGKVRVRLYHTMLGVLTHNLYLDEVSIRRYL